MALVASGFLAPSWDAITQDADVAFLPEDSPSRRAEAISQTAFPDQHSGSTIVLVLTRSAGQLQDQDEAFVEQTLVPRLEQFAAARKGLVMRIRSLAERSSGALLVSLDHQATLIVIDLTAPFLDPRSSPLVHEVENIVASFRQSGDVPSGLAIALSGSATAGRDYAQ